MLLKREDNGNLRMILQSELNARNKIATVEALIIPELRENYFIINWRLEEIQKVHKSNGKILIMYKMLVQIGYTSKGKEEEGAFGKLKRHAKRR